MIDGRKLAPDSACGMESRRMVAVEVPFVFAKNLLVPQQQQDGRGERVKTKENGRICAKSSRNWRIQCGKNRVDGAGPSFPSKIKTSGKAKNRRTKRAEKTKRADAESAPARFGRNPGSIT